MSLFDLVQTIQIINLPFRTDRRREMTAELESKNCPAGKAEFFDAIRPDCTAGFPTIGARGCFLSHVTVLRNFANGSDEAMLVLEDDVKLLDVTSTLFDEIDRVDWDIIYFGRSNKPAEKTTATLTKLEPGEPVQGTYCYAISRDTAGKLATYMESCLTREPGDPEGGPMHADGAFNMLRQRDPSLNVFLTEPYIIGCRRSGSDVHDTSITQMERSIPFANTVLSMVRKIRNRLD